MTTSGQTGPIRGDDRELVEVAFASDAVETEMIRGLLESAGIPSLAQRAGLNVDGPMLGFGLLARGFGGGPQRVMVHAGRAERARALLAETMVEDPEAAAEEIANASFLEEARGRGPRGYGVLGAYARFYVVAIAVFAVAFGLFMLLRVL